MCLQIHFQKYYFQPRIYAINTDIAIAWIGQLTFDIFVFLLTLLQTLRIRKTGRRSITDVFLRDGVCVLRLCFR